MLDFTNRCVSNESVEYARHETRISRVNHRYQFQFLTSSCCTQNSARFVNYLIDTFIRKVSNKIIKKHFRGKSRMKKRARGRSAASEEKHTELRFRKSENAFGSIAGKTRRLG